MGGLLRILGSIFAYTCVATILAQAMGLTYAWSSGKVDRDKLFKVLAVVHDIDLETILGKKEQVKNTAQEPVRLSLDEIDRLRKIKSRDLEVRAEFLTKGLEELRHQRDQFTGLKDNFDQRRTAFHEHLSKLQDKAITDGNSNARLILETIKAAQAKELIMKMVDADEINDVVVILADMPIDKVAEIVGTFRSKEEKDALDRIIRLVRTGDAVNTLIEKTLDRNRNN